MCARAVGIAFGCRSGSQTATKVVASVSVIIYSPLSQFPPPPPFSFKGDVHIYFPWFLKLAHIRTIISKNELNQIKNKKMGAKKHHPA